MGVGGGREGGGGRLVFSCIASGVKLLLFDSANFKRLVMQFKSLDMLLQLKHILPRVVKSSRLLAKIAACLVSIGQLVCLAFLYGWCFLNKISLVWLLTLTTQPSTSKLSDNPDCPGYLFWKCNTGDHTLVFCSCSVSSINSSESSLIALNLSHLKSAMICLAF